MDGEVKRCYPFLYSSLVRLVLDGAPENLVGQLWGASISLPNDFFLRGGGEGVVEEEGERSLETPTS